MTQTAETTKGMIEAASLTAKFPEKDFIVLLSDSLMEVSPIQKVSYELVKIDPNKDNGEVFQPQGSKKLALGKTAIEKLAHAAGVKTDPNPQFTGRFQIDAKNFEYRVRLTLQRPDGLELEHSASVSVNLEDVIEGLTAEVNKKALDGKIGKWEGRGDDSRLIPWPVGSKELMAAVDLTVAAEIAKAKKFEGRKAETGAYNRAARAILGLKPSYTVQELNKRFVVPRVSVDMNKVLKEFPHLAEGLIHRALGARQEIFGGRQLTAGTRATVVVTEPPTPLTAEEEVQVAEVVSDAEPETRSEETGAAILKNATLAISPEVLAKREAKTTEAEYKTTWANAPAAARVSEIEHLILTKKFVPKEGSRTLDKMSAQEQVAYLWFLYNKPTPAVEELAPLPFAN